LQAGDTIQDPQLSLIAPVSVLVADFENHTGDPVFDGTLEPVFNTALEGAKFVNAFSRGEARRLAKQLPNGNRQAQRANVRLLSRSQGLGAVVTGSLSSRGSDGYKISVEALDGATGKNIASADITVAKKDDVLLAIPKLVAPIRKALGDTTPESVQLAAAETFTYWITRSGPPIRRWRRAASPTVRWKRRLKSLARRLKSTRISAGLIPEWLQPLATWASGTMPSGTSKRR
jgi:hypothetical protein